MGFFESLASSTSSFVSSPSALKRLSTGEIRNMKSNLLETMGKNEPGSQLYNSCKDGLYNIDNELRARGEY